MVVAFTPEDVQLVIGPPADRRRALDILISQIDRTYMRKLAGYGRVLRQRNGLLKAFARDHVRHDAAAAITQLSFWDEQLAGEGGYLIARRAEVVSELSQAMDRHAASLSASVHFGVDYEPRTHVDVDAIVAEEARADAIARATDAFRRDLELHREDEFRRGMTLTGPHRDDVVFSIEGRSLARFGSRGQQRLGVLALKLAEADVMTAQTGDTPVFLLDDVLSELDAVHRRLLLDDLAVKQAQVILTSAEDAALDHESLGDLAVFQTGSGGTDTG
jgi:DNA replication and repair protein RecF